MNWTPSHVVVTVTKARNLLDKGKGGNDAYCMIGMGKEKFLTSVKAKTLAPTWDEQAEFALGEREDLKLTVYHKSSIIDEFIGRVVINVSELASFDTNHSHVGWFKLGGKPDKSDHKKAEKDRGEIEVRIDFLVKPKAGSMMDLSLKSKEKSLSLRNLKEKSSTLKQSFGDKLKILQKGRKSKYAGENQLAEQAKRMGGSKIDFLDGDDVTSITSSYSSINGSNLQRFNDSKQINSMSRFNPTRSSFVSGSSSRLENDSSSNYGNDNTRNEEDFEDENDSADFDRDSANGSSFQRRNSSKFGRSTNASIKRQLSRRSSTLSTPIIENLNIINEHSKIETNEDDSSNKDSIHIAPLPPFNNSTSTPALAQRNKKAPAPKSPEKIPSKVSSPTQNNQDSFASIFAASFGSNNKSDINNSTSSHSTLTQTNTSQTTSNGSNLTSASINSSINQSILTKNEIINKPESPKKQAPQPPSVQLQPPSLPPLPPSVSAKAKKNMNYSHDEEDEDHIDWASSEDEEIVKQEIESFERNQLSRQSERRRLMPAEDLTSDLNSETDFNTLSARNKQAKLSLNQRNANKNKMQIDLKTTSDQTTVDDYDVKTPDLDIDFRFQEETNKKMDTTNDSSNGAMSNDNSNNSGRNNGLPDLINQKGNNDSTDKARKYLEGLDGVKFNEIQVPDQLKKQLEYFDRDELLQLIAYQKKYLDFKESRIKDLENYIDNLVVKIIEKEPSILMNASNVLTKSRNLI